MNNRHSSTTSRNDTRRECHYSSRAMQHSNHFVTNSKHSIEQLKAFSPCLAFAVRHTTPVLRGIPRVGESDIVAPATGDLCDGCKTTEQHASDSAEQDHSLQESYAVLSITSEIHTLAGDRPAPTVRHACPPVRATTSSLASIHDSDLPSGVYKNNSKPTIDRNFFKSMAKTIKANRASRADAEVVDEEACTHYTGNYTSNLCGEKTRYANWIVGHAMRVRIELKFSLIRERMLASEALNNRRLRR